MQPWYAEKTKKKLTPFTYAQISETKYKNLLCVNWSSLLWKEQSEKIGYEDVSLYGKLKCFAHSLHKG